MSYVKRAKRQKIYFDTSDTFRIEYRSRSEERFDFEIIDISKSGISILSKSKPLVDIDGELILHFQFQKKIKLSLKANLKRVTANSLYGRNTKKLNSSYKMSIKFQEEQEALFVKVTEGRWDETLKAG